MKFHNVITKLLGSFIGSGLTCLPAFSEENSFIIKADAVFIASAMEDDGASKKAPFTTELGVEIETEHYFDNGMSLGFVGEIRGQLDNEEKQGFAGQISFSDYQNTSFVDMRSPSTGIVVSDHDVKYGPYASIEQAFVYFKTGWGEVSLGRDIGVATRLDARAPKVLDYGSVNSSRLNVLSSSIVRSKNDVTGPNSKLSYTTPRILGLKAGISFTPNTKSRGIDFNSGTGVLGVQNADLENVIESGVSFSHLFRQQDLRVRFGLTGTAAESSNENAGFSEYRAVGIGSEFEKGPWKFGSRYLHSNNAIDGNVGKYTALEMGLTRDLMDWTVGLEYGNAIDKILKLKGENVSFGIARDVNEHAKIGVSFISTDTKHFDHSFSGKGVMFELVVRYK